MTKSSTEGINRGNVHTVRRALRHAVDHAYHDDFETALDVLAMIENPPPAVSRLTSDLARAVRMNNAVLGELEELLDDLGGARP